jgi:hypothetical protein
MSVGQINLIRYAVREATRIALKEKSELSILNYVIMRASYHG